MGESQHSLNPTDRNVQPYSQLGAISRAGGCEWHSFINAARKWLGAALGNAGSLGQLAIVQPAPARLLINQGLSSAVVGTVPGPPWEQRAFLRYGICRLKRETSDTLAIPGT